MSAPRRRCAASLVAAVSLLCASCTDSAPDPVADSSSQDDPLPSYDTTGVALTRAPFCEQLPDAAVEDALGEAPSAVSHHGNGDRARLAPGVRDIAHEYGCTFRADNGMTARAWLFAPPVTVARARVLLREALGPGCAAAEQVGFGSPSISTRCASQGFVEESRRGLFGDAWLSCALAVTGPEEPEDMAERTDRWCAQVVEAARAR